MKKGQEGSRIIRASEAEAEHFINIAPIADALHAGKMKCKECGTVHSVDHATECTGCGEPNESLVELHR